MSEQSKLSKIADFFFSIEEEEFDPQFGPNSLVLVLTNCTPAEAPTIAETLVREHYAACVNVLPGVKSYYIWKGEFCADDETTLLIKTTEHVADALVRRLRTLHSYETPEMLMVKPDGVDPRYQRWAREQTASPTL